MQVKRGDIILVHSHNFTAKLIQLGMNIERWRKLDFSPLWEKVYNHAAICISDGVISEALPKGITVDYIENTYEKDKNKDILIYRVPLNSSQHRLLYFMATRYEGVNYQFINFLQFVPKIFFGIWLGQTHKQAQDLLYCTEYVALVLHNTTGGKLFPKYWRTSPNDIHKWCEKNAKQVGEYHL